MVGCRVGGTYIICEGIEVYDVCRIGFNITHTTAATHSFIMSIANPSQLLPLLDHP